MYHWLLSHTHIIYFFDFNPWQRTLLYRNTCVTPVTRATYWAIVTYVFVNRVICRSGNGMFVCVAKPMESNVSKSWIAMPNSFFMWIHLIITSVKWGHFDRSVAGITRENFHMVYWFCKTNLTKHDASKHRIYKAGKRNCFVNMIKMSIFTVRGLKRLIINPFPRSCRIYELVSIGSKNALPPIGRQTIILINAHLLSIGPLGTNFSDISIKVQIFTCTKMHLKISSAKWWSVFCMGRWVNSLVQL